MFIFQGIQPQNGGVVVSLTTVEGIKVWPGFKPKMENFVFDFRQTCLPKHSQYQEYSAYIYVDKYHTQITHVYDKKPSKQPHRYL